ncbi:hypothetical protein, partial [Escherichia coli]|uniref:hypothetical protein n=1 Tax=Escherichia coli TaxID=562 RepID=UPI0039DF73FE
SLFLQAFWGVGADALEMHTGLTEQEKAEGERAKQALEEEAGGEDGDGDYKGKSQFFTHLKKSEV